jgi:flagellar biosynthesis protein FlhF
MKMKKFKAPTIAEAMKQIRSELGDDAVILNSKVVTTKKFFGMVKSKHFEVTAGIDRVEQKPLDLNFSSNTFKDYKQSEQLVTPPKTFDERLATSQENTAVNVQSTAVASVVENNEGLTNELKKEINDLKLIMQSLKKEKLEDNYSEELQQVVDFLRLQELDEELITEISDELFGYTKQQLSKKELLQKTSSILYDKLSDLPIEGLDYSKKYIHVLGPTGVGKTTTIAKMAARSVLEKKKKIGFITTDTYRIAAIEQLKTYAALLQAPLEIVYTRQDYEAALKKLDHLDLIFIDTAGRNYKESKYVTDLQKMIQFDHTAQSFLVLSLTAKQRDLETIIEQFKEIPINKFIFTKVDETNSIGTMFNLMIKYNKGLAYYTDGQEVPEDIVQGDIKGLLEMFFQGEV